MSAPEQPNASDALREWLRNERRLGITHVSVSPASISPSPRSPAIGPAPAPAPAPPPPPRAAPPGDRAYVPPSTALPVPRGTAPPRPGRSAAAPVPLFVADPDLPPPCDRELSVDEARAALAELNERYVRQCRKCRLHEQRTQTVFGVGHPRAELVFVGEGPGADEDAQGEPFVGRAGQLLTRMIAAMTLTREQVYICNVVKCRPPGNRTPLDDEIQPCSPYLVRQLAVLRPKVIVTLGRPAAQTLLATGASMSELRGRWHDFPPPALAPHGLSACRLMPTYHPAYLLRNPAAKGDVWQDLQEVMAFLKLQPAVRR